VHCHRRRHPGRRGLRSRETRTRACRAGRRGHDCARTGARPEGRRTGRLFAGVAGKEEHRIRLAWRRRWRDDSHAQLDTSAAWLAAVFWYCQPTAEQAFVRLGVRTGPEGRDARRVDDWRYGDLARASDGAHDETQDSCRKRTPCSRSVVLIDSFDSAFDIDDVDSGLLDPEPRRCVYGRVATKLVSWLVPAGGGSRGTGDCGWPGMMHRPVALSSVATPSTTS